MHPPDPVRIATAMERASLDPSPSRSIPPVAAAVVSWNTRELLARCLRAMAPEVQAGRASVWVVDNASTDGSPALVRDEYPWAHLVACEENLGFGPAVNLVAQRTQTPWLAIANADTALLPGALARLLQAASEQPQAGILAPRLILPDGSTQHSAYSFPTLPFTIAFNLGLGSLSRPLAERMLLMGSWDGDRSRWVDWAIGAFLLVRRSAWEASGGFDPAQWMYAEDLDLGWRMAAAGWRTWFEASASVSHHGAAAASLLWGDDRDVRWQRSTYAWMLRRRGLAMTRTVALVNTLGAGTRAAIWALPARLRDGEWASRERALRRWTKLHGSNLLASRADLERHR